jgi:hypothetical protein
MRCVGEYLKLSCYSSAETKTTIGIANLPHEVQAISIRWILPGGSRKIMKKSTTKAGVPAEIRTKHLLNESAN